MNCKFLKTKSYIEDVDSKGIVTIRVSAFNNIDSYGDVMDATAFNKSISDFKASGRTRVKHLKNHDWNQAIGVPLEMNVTDKGLDIVSKINIRKSVGNDVYEDYKFYAENNQTLEHSIGYTVVKSEPMEDVTLLKEVNLLEYSTLDFLGANEQAVTLDIKNAEMQSNELVKRIEDLEARLKALEPQSTQAVEEKAEEPAIDVNILSKLNLG